MKYERARNVLELIFWWPMRVRTRMRSRAKRKARMQALTTARETLIGFDKLNAESHRKLFNVGLYLILLDQDLADFTENIVFAIGEPRRTFFAKHEAVLLYEAAEDLPQLLGRDLRDTVKALHISAEHQQSLNVVSSDLNKFWQANRQFLGNIRNALAAHREHDALRYLELLDQIKPLEVMQRAADLSVLLGSLMRIVTQIAIATHSRPASLLNDIIDSSKKKRAV